MFLCFLYKKSIYLTNERQTCKSNIVQTNKGLKGWKNYDYIDRKKRYRKELRSEDFPFISVIQKEIRRIYVKDVEKRSDAFSKSQTEGIAGITRSV